MHGKGPLVGRLRPTPRTSATPRTASQPDDPESAAAGTRGSGVDHSTLTEQIVSTLRRVRGGDGGYTATVAVLSSIVKALEESVTALKGGGT